MGNSRAKKFIEVRDRARRALAAETAELAARQKRIEGALGEVWSAIEVRSVRAGRRDARIEKLRATFEAGREKARADYQADAAKIRDRYTVAVQQLRADGKAPTEISELTGLTSVEVREALGASLPSAEKTRPETSRRCRRPDPLPGNPAEASAGLASGASDET